MNTHQPPNLLKPTQTQKNLMNWDNNLYATKNISSSSSSFSASSKEFVDFSACKREEQRQMAQLPDDQPTMKKLDLAGGMEFECIADEDLQEMLSYDLPSWLNNDTNFVAKPVISCHDNTNNICAEIRKNNFSDCQEISKNNFSKCEEIRKNTFSNCEEVRKNNFSNCEEMGKNKFSNEGKLSDETESKSHESSPPLIDGEFSSLSDLKRQRRILANRQSAQRSRVRKLHYITDLESKVATLQNEVSSMTPQVAYLDQQRSILAISNGNLKQRIAALTQDKKFKDAHHDALRKEIERLTLLHEQQTAQKMGMNEAESVPEPNSPGSAKETEAQPQSS